MDAKSVFAIDDDGVKRLLTNLKKVMSDMSPIMNDIGQTLQDKIHESLGRGYTPWGQKMVPLKSRDGVPLNDTRAHIYDRITHAYDKTSVAVGMNEEVAIGYTHQFGAIIKPRNANALVFTVRGKKVIAKQVTIPARPFLPIIDNAVVLPEEWRDSIIKSLRDAIRDAAG